MEASIKSSTSFSSSMLLFVLLVSSVTSVQVYSVQPSITAISVSPPSVTVSIGQNFAIDVVVSSVSDLYGWEFKLSWDPSLLDTINVAEGAFLKAGGDTFFYYNLNTTAGRMVVDCTLLGDVNGVSGSGTLARITFAVKNVGDCPLDLYDVILLNSLEIQIPCQVNDGYGYFTHLHDIAVTDVNVSQIIALPGTLVDIDVTVQNQGYYSETFLVAVYVNSEMIEEQQTSLASGSLATLQFQWNTTGYTKGDYVILAEASVVGNEVDVADNSKIAVDMVTILFVGHDIAVKDVESLKTFVGQGYCTLITVVVKNYGVFSESFNVTVFTNSIVIHRETVLLLSGAVASLAFEWNTFDFTRGDYNISAQAESVSGETCIEDNTYTNCWVTVTIPGDLNGDFCVKLVDLVILACAYGSEPGSLSWNPNADIDNNHSVGLSDLVIVAKHYEQHFS